VNERVRRPKGSGSIVFQAKENRYRGAVIRNGEYYRVYAATEAECEKRLAHLIADLERDIKPRKRGPDTVESFLTAWLRDRIKPHREPKTYRTHESYVRRYIIPSLGKKALTQLSISDVQRFVNDLMTTTGRYKKPLAPRTIVQIRAILRAALNDAIREEKITHNPAALVRPPRTRRYRATALSPEQARGFLRVVRGDQHEAIFTVAIACGLRIGEVLALRWYDPEARDGDVDLERGVLVVNHGLDRVDGAYVLKDPKTDDSQRVLAIPQGVIDALRRRQAVQTEEREQAGGAWSDRFGLVFTTHSRYGSGRPINGSWVTHRLQQILEMNGLPKVRFHDLRHSCASILIAEGASLQDVKNQLGHSQIALVSQTYGHQFENARRETARRMDRALWESDGS